MYLITLPVGFLSPKLDVSQLFECIVDDEDAKALTYGDGIRTLFWDEPRNLEPWYIHLKKLSSSRCPVEPPKRNQGTADLNQPPRVG
ncbi:hypothetical protein AVEN_227440-1 [Araneus ventricosus]|uniref:Uncharacterized protein n=1 Tax=Araneus ventricosus TaxID=182803 RepID=A0A4Y2V2F7_ARAVE|nr:hypothetical protein AVEN_227440-1 [Araneus ventricosus]